MTETTAYQPKDLILDLMRAISPESLDVKTLISIGTLFGFNDNQIRVAITRLAQAQQLFSGERGVYSLGTQGQESALYSQDWRMGEDRLRFWDGFWFMVALPPALERPYHRRALQALEHMGFRPGLRSLYVRPANLWLSTGSMRQRLHGLGLDASCQLWKAEDIDPGLAKDWHDLWEAEGWEEKHRSARKRLEKSQTHFQAMTSDEQLRESFLIGGESIRLLVTDPLLPEEIAKGKERRLHTAAMQTYDEAARKLWLDRLQTWRIES